MRNNEAKYEHYVATLWDPKDHPDLVPTRLYNKISYIIYGLEHSKEGREHLQMYIQCTHPIRKSTFEKIFPSPIWSKPAKGSDEHNQKYCSKEGHTTEFGTRRAIASLAEKINQPRLTYIERFRNYLHDNRLQHTKQLFDLCSLSYYLQLYSQEGQTAKDYFNYLEGETHRIDISHLNFLFKQYAIQEQVYLNTNQRKEIEFYFDLIKYKTDKTQPKDFSLELLEDF